jgi:chitodextrinase
MLRHPAVPVLALLLATACAETDPRGLATGPTDPVSETDVTPPVNTGAILVTPAAPVEGQLASFESVVPVTDPTSEHAWDFGDGTTATGRQVEHAYASPGSYRVYLTVWSGGVVVETGEMDVAVARATADARPGR